MSIVRAFIALELPDAMQRELDKLSVALQRLLSDLPLRWVRTENIHLTLIFLGKTKQQDLPLITAIIEQQAQTIAPMQVEFSEFGVFPNAQKPLVLWVGVKAPAELQVLQQGIQTKLAELGYPAEERSFTPHLTLARVRREHRLANLRRIGEVMASVKLEPTAAALIDSVTLFRSDLKPGGSVYNPLSRIPLLGRR
ncbi:MAG TPA: RNA 2',3'-cyclic phosphodiesterase [Anaerolineales bacterium]|nr:RNA 2',3'-cyclic phosphodiesterase [Anaerolineales bacterium]HLE73653.1 RNA 2',3'-cyclic phosphodiesterase [Anaerolineales bacterium]